MCAPQSASFRLIIFDEQDVSPLLPPRDFPQAAKARVDLALLLLQAIDILGCVRATGIEDLEAKKLRLRALASAVGWACEGLELEGRRDLIGRSLGCYGLLLKGQECSKGLLLD